MAAARRARTWAWALASLGGWLAPATVSADEAPHGAAAPAPPPADEARDDTDEPPVVADDASEPPPDPLGPDAAMDRWCAPELEVVGDDVCAFTPKQAAAGPRTLVIFLHGVVKPDTQWQWAQQRGAARAAEAHGFTVLMPRGRAGIGPKGMESWWSWPTAASAQARVEDELVGEWRAARGALESRSGAPFERVWVFGFSNGAYYATSLAMRGRLADADGFAVFAGGSGASYLEKSGQAQKRRAPFFVAWGERDPAHGDQVKLAKLLRRLRWPSKSEGAKRAGHAMTDKQVTDAVQFLSHAAREAADAPKPARRAPTKAKTKGPPPKRGRG